MLFVYIFSMSLSWHEKNKESESKNRSWVVIFHLRRPMACLSFNLYDTSGLAPRMNVLFWGPGDFPVSYPNMDTLWNAWIVIQEVLWSIRGSYSAIWRKPLTNFIWHSYPWPTVTSQPIRLSTNIMTFIPSLIFTESWVVSMKHLQRVWLASRERLLFRTPGSVPIFGTCLCSNCWDQIPRTCHIFTRLFTLNTPWYFLDFPSIKYVTYIPHTRTSYKYSCIKLIKHSTKLIEKICKYWWHI